MTTRSPQWHYEQADRLITEAATECAPTIAQQKTARAHVHALLAQCVTPVQVISDGHVNGAVL